MFHVSAFLDVEFLETIYSVSYNSMYLDVEYQATVHGVYHISAYPTDSTWGVSH
jgi:hypothetical protein